MINAMRSNGLLCFDSNTVGTLSFEFLAVKILMRCGAYLDLYFLGIYQKGTKGFLKNVYSVMMIQP